MMGYTHAAFGAAGAVAVATFCGNGTGEYFMVATVAGVLGGVAVDAEVKDQYKEEKGKAKVTDAGMSRLLALGLIALGVILDLIFKLGVLTDIVSRGSITLVGVMGFVILMIICHFTSKHRTFTHSLLFLLISAALVYSVCPYATWYYLIGSALHLLLDMLNYPFEGHGIWLLYPWKTGKGIALGKCKSGRTGNRILFYVGMALYVVFSIVYAVKSVNKENMAILIPVAIYMIAVSIIVCFKSEKQQRHIMHMRGEL